MRLFTSKSCHTNISVGGEHQNLGLAQYLLPLTCLPCSLALILISLAVLSFSLPISHLFLLLIFGPYTRVSKNSPAQCMWRFKKIYLLVYK